MTPESEKKLYKAAIVDTNELVKAQARDIADARMAESKEDRSGNLAMRTAKRIWKHNLAEEWYRQREISRVKKEIHETGNLYAGENEFDPDQDDETASDTASKEAQQAIIDRFTSEYEQEMLEEEERESKYVLEDESANIQIKDLIKQYARSEMEQADFEEQKKRILSRYDEQFASKKSLYADNLLSIANEVRDNIREKGKLAEFDFDIEITLGKARETLSTQAHLRSFDKCVEKMQNNKIGKWIANEPTALAITAGLWEVGRNTIQKTVRSKAVQWGTFGAAAVLAGGMSAYKERARITRERAQHQREEAKGMQFNEDDMKRRQEMEKNSYDTRKATNITENLKTDLEKLKEGNLSEEDRTSILGDIADLEARLQLNRERSIDLIVYDKFNVIEKDRNTMRQTLAELKKELREDATPEEFDAQIEDMIWVQKTQLLGGENGIEEKDEVFRKLRNNKAWKAFATTTLISASVGAVFHEGKMLFDDATMPHTELHTDTFGDSPTHVQLPNGVTFAENSDRTYNLVKDGHVISENIPVRFDAHGNLSEETRQALAKDGITSDFGLCGDTTTENVHQSVHDYVKDHASEMQTVHRHTFFDQDSKVTIKNASKLDWGGVNGTGIDEHGNYVFNVSHMTANGSYHHSIKLDAADGIKKGHEEMEFSLSTDTQHQVFEVPIDSNGNAVIDPHSTLGKIMFENSNGHAVFHGRFAEAVNEEGVGPDGAKNVSVLATYEGQGKEFVDTVVSKDTTVPNVLLHIPYNTGDVPLPFGMVGARRPLEQGEYKKDSSIEASRSRTTETVEVATAPVPNNLPVEQSGQKIALDQETKEDIKTELKDTEPKNAKNAEKEAEARWDKTPEEQTVRDYFSFRDKVDDIDFLNRQYENTHDKDGNLNLNMQLYAKKVLEIENDDKKFEAFDAASEKLVSYVNGIIAQVGATADPKTQSRSWALYSIAKMQSNFERSGGRSKGGKDPIGDVLSWQDKKEGQKALKLLQNMADRELGFALVSLKTNFKEKLLEKIAGTKQENEIRSLVEKALKVNDDETKLSNAQFMELGKLIRESQSIEPIKSVK